MAESIYLLRSTSEGVPYYLSHVSANGCNIEFDRRIIFGLVFTALERKNFAAEHGHIRGRWVLVDREHRRILSALSAASAQPADQNKMEKN